MSEEFDDIIRQKFAEKEFIFNEANWEKAEMKIDASIRFKKILWWSSIFSIGLIAGISLMFLLNRKTTEFTGSKKDSDKKITENSTVSTQPPVSAIPTTDTQAASTEDVAKTNSIRTEEIMEGPDFASSEKSTSTSTKNKKQNSSAFNNSNNVAEKEGPASATNKINQLKSDRTKSNNSTAISKEELVNKNNNAFATAKNKKRKTKNSISDSTQDLQEEDPASLSSLTSDKTENETAKISETTASVKKSKASLSSKDAVAKKKETGKKKELKADNLIADDSGTTTSEAQDSTLALETKLKIENSSTADSLNESSTSLTAAVTDSLKKNDSVPALSKPSEPAVPLGMDGLASINLFSIDAGINGQLGWKYQDKNEARGFTPVLGIGITHCFNQKWSVNAALHYTTIAYLKANNLTNTKVYSFGVNSSTSTLQPPRILHYVTIPLFVQYQLNEKNAIYAGAGISYLINNKIRIESNQNIVSPTYQAVQNSTMPTPTSHSGSGYYNKWDASVAAGYRRKLTGHFSIASIAYFGLMDIKKDNYFNHTQFERNSGLKLILSYTIFDF